MIACEMIPEYVPCSLCPRFPKGYPVGEYVKISYGGDCWIARSIQTDNETNPVDYIGNDSSAKPWVVLKFMPMIEWIARNLT